MSTTSNRVLALFGPTACGKTDLLLKLFAANDRSLKRPVVVISADSVQVYRGLDIGSAKPDAGLLRLLPHELIDVRDPREAFSVGDFVRLADEACERALAAGALPVISGGTAFYIKAFMFGLPSAPIASDEQRLAVQDDFKRLGPQAMMEELCLVDPMSASRIEPNDHYRIARALEVFRASGKPLSSYRVPTSPRSRWTVLPLAIERPRSELYARVEARVDAMMAAGLPQELACLAAAGLGPDDPGLRAIGYAEFFAEDALATVSGRWEGEGLERVAAAIKLHTRRYAKRQLTFMRALPGVLWRHPDDSARIEADIRAWLGA
ncbi:MAG TPA: tRNA (adenosine(37)-N6)-dimethylallyltransferase MiaA [Spirochaetaceae bacterium]|nr:tRNA (adenosine(37)-N6)-dimethylallyltransferase MiaA [Spirochaetaceae bacterium]